MKKEKYTIEYPLKKSSSSILWKLIATPTGLAEWFSDDVLVKEENVKYGFVWDGYEEIASVIKSKDGKLIRLQWEEDTDTEAYFQFEIVQDKLSGQLTLVITDFAELDEQEDNVLLWNKHVESLRRLAGM